MSLVQIVQGDALSVLRSAPDNCIQICVTSPPYFSLRDYQCNGQIGLEKTPWEYVDRLVEVFREVRRVLRSDGVFWLNIGDCYSSGSRTWRAPDKKSSARAMSSRPSNISGIKPKDLIGVPWMLAFALRDDGWFLRSECIWERPNCLPESVKDRPTKIHEQLFMLAKNETYFYDLEAVREPFQTDPKENYPKRARVTGRGKQISSAASTSGAQQDKSGGYPPGGNGRNARSVWRNREPMMKLRSDISDADRVYVLAELLRRGL